MTAESSGAASKAVVQKWMEVGIQSPEGAAMVTDDFAWIGPPSHAYLFGTEDATCRGRDAIPRVAMTDKAVYNLQAPYEWNIHFLIAEGDIVVMEFDAAFELLDGGRYHNQYCMVIRVRGDKIAEVREHADTLYWETVCVGTPERKAAVMDRLARLRAGGEI